MSLLLILAAFTNGVYAAADGNDNMSTKSDDYSAETFISDHVNLEDATNEVEGGAFSSVSKKATNYLTYFLAGAICLFVMICGKYFFTDGGEGKSKAYLLLISGIVFIILAKCGLIEALGTLV